MIKESDVIGAKIVCNGTSAIVESINYLDSGRSSFTDYIDVEFIDTNGNLRSYKSLYDGGKVIWKDGTETEYKEIEL